MSDDLLIVDNLGKKLNHTTILNHVSFTLPQGESLLIKGPSGCGKTTLLRCLSLLEPIDQGRILLNGETVSKRTYTRHPAESDRHEIGMVFQQLYLWSHLTVLDNIALPLYLRNGKNKKAAESVALNQLAHLGIDHKAQDYPSQLSGGQRQRVALARALVHSPKLLLLDEITANLDPETADKVMEIIETIAKTGTSIVLVSHAHLNTVFWSQVLSFHNNIWNIAPSSSSC